MPTYEYDPIYYLIASCMMHMEGYYSTKSLAYRNRNPGNIERANGEFIKYGTAVDGYLALVNDIWLNRGKYLREFLLKYAPPTENDTVAYTSIVAQLSGVPAYQPMQKYEISARNQGQSV